jgi:hypothetical protein
MASHDAFAARLADILATLESTAMLGAVERRVRGLDGLLRFACASVPCDEAFVAVEREHLGRMHVPGVATTDAWRPASVDLPPLGTPFSYLLAGGSGHMVDLDAEDPLLESLRGVVTSSPRQGAFAPIRLGADVVGGLALLFAERRSGDRELVLAERLADVAAGTIEAYRTERALLEVFAAVVPELCATDGETGFSRGLERFVHRLRLTPDYRRKLALADAVAKVARRGEAESALAIGVLTQLERYATTLEGSAPFEGGRGREDELP